MKEFPILETKDLVLRKLELTDYENYYDYVTDELISKQFLFNHTEESCHERLEELVSKYEDERKPFVWAIALKETNELVGLISIDSISFANKKFSIAYGIRKKHRSHSYSYQASFALIDYIFNNFDMHRLEIAHNTDNIASMKTIKKLGAKFEGIARESKFYDNGFKDRKIYSILKPEWENAKNKVVKL